MSRIDGNFENREEMIKKVDYLKTDEQQFMCCVIGLLTDISISLATIADALEEESKHE